MKKRWMIKCGMAGMLLCVCGNVVFAQDAEKKPWSDSAEISLVNTTGNTESQTTSAKNSFHYGWRITSLDVIASALGARSDEARPIAEQYNASEKISQYVTERNYFYEKVEWYKNRFADIKNQYSSSGGFGRELIKTAIDNLILELGAGYVEEQRYIIDNRNFISGRAYTKYARVLSATASFMQDAEYLHNFKDADGYRVTANAELIASISTHWSIKLGYQWKFNNKPGLGYAKSDTVTTVAILVNY